MDDKQKKRIIMVIIIAFLLLLILILWFCMQYIELKEEKNANVPSSSVIPQATSTDIFTNNNVKVKKEDDNKMYVEFDKDLYSDDGANNQDYYEKIINELNSLKPRSDYYLIDEDKEIEIHVKVRSNGTYDYEINGLNNYFKKVDGKVYSEVNNSKLNKTDNILSNNNITYTLYSNSSYFSHISDMMGEGREEKNGYTSYKNGEILIRQSPIKTVRNMIFTNLYSDEVARENIRVGTSLKDIKDQYPNNAFGGINEGYLGYISDYYYYFFYPNEISIYTYSYSKNTKFEKALVEYLESKDLETFIIKLKGGFEVYDSFEHDEGSDDLTMIYSNRGIEIKIRKNDPKGIILHNNYYFTETTRDLVKEGVISFSNDDLVDIYEKERRNR